MEDKPQIGPTRLRQRKAEGAPPHDIAAEGDPIRIFVRLKREPPPHFVSYEEWMREKPIERELAKLGVSPRKEWVHLSLGDLGQLFQDFENLLPLGLPVSTNHVELTDMHYTVEYVSLSSPLEFVIAAGSAGSFVLTLIKLIQNWSASKRVALAKAVDAESRSRLFDELVTHLSNELRKGNEPLTEVVLRHMFHRDSLIQSLRRLPPASEMDIEST